MEDIILNIFIICTAIRLYYYFGIFGKLALYNKRSSLKVTYPVSVIICAMNEARNLLTNLPSVLEQEYNDFEVIVVNDSSNDETADVLDKFLKKYDNLKVITIKNGDDGNISSGKKLALTSGINAATNDLLLLTDADCAPAGKLWISTMQSNFMAGIDIILGYCTYKKTTGLLNKLIRFDAFFVALQYLSFSLIGKTYMGVGRNLAYRKSLFMKNMGFESHFNIQSGDDDLFVNESATNDNVRIEIQNEAHTISEAKTTLWDWLLQKRRHLTTGFYYKFNQKILLGTFYLNCFFFFLALFTLLSMGYKRNIVLFLFAFQLILQYVVIKKCMNRLGERDLLLFSPIYELSFLLFNSFVVLTNLIIKNNKWK
ncbi:MAG: glycosyltransferase [Bacteroidota bacterium]